jgi:hypothetical protein
MSCVHLWSSEKCKKKKKKKKKKRKFDQCEDKSPASRLVLTIFLSIEIKMKECRICLCCYFIDYRENVERLCPLIILVFIQINDLNRWSFPMMFIIIISRCIRAELTICFATFLLLLEYNTIAKRLFSRYRLYYFILLTIVQ